ncbi:alkaline phosphatase family protein [Microbacterium paraoxydans]|uniref:alkaline phosphatase family protein n=1 Tax=Microbacterium paraoxydans TaxID=199592 RepID=UPI0022858F65|nr:nucleotide pyrophosphatase/phosphodiesterase family protein [Microbacterium paraoxydans]MCZ0708521.1 alkaline phosphatase family protein [Microbacterium paraoxydans]
MSFMLPSAPPGARSVVGVADDLCAALRGESATLPRADAVVLVVIDGLGAISLRGHAGHARSLTASMTKKDIAQTVFPTTTAAALTSLTTGVWPGEHGLVGYRVRDPKRDVLVNQLSGWETDGLDPLTWQAAPTVFERAAVAGRETFAVGLATYAHSGFTRATLRGATFVPAATPEERVEVAYTLAEEHPGSLVYCYLPEVDKAGHKHGVSSAEWVAALERIDGALSLRVPPRVGVVVTSDHGMVDVPFHRQVVLEEQHLGGIRHVGGEPRMLHLYREPDADAALVTTRLRSDLEGAADVVTREEAVRAGLFGPVVRDEVLDRIGDVLVIATGVRALYDGTAEDQRNRGMVGQHGALTPDETRVPFLRFGAFAS